LPCCWRVLLLLLVVLVLLLVDGLDVASSG
jgi:hypothetical protein